MEAEDGSLSRSGSALAGTRYENLMSCTGLTDLDTLTKSDPMCVLFYKRFGQWREVGRTEAIKNTLNTKSVLMLKGDQYTRRTKTYRAKEGHYKELPLAPNKEGNKTNSIKISNKGFLRFFQVSAISRYKKAVKHIRMSGSTRLKPVISFTESLAVRGPAQDNQIYHVLLVITDGILNNIDDVLESLTSINNLPLTVVFAVVGPADFKLMECFSQDSNGFVGIKNRTTTFNRKHTHFISFSQENGQNIDLDRLITEYMRRKDIIPNKPSLTRLPRSHSSASLISTSQTEGRGLSRRSASITSLISRNSMSNATDPKCPTCGSVLDNGSSSVTIQSSAEVIL